MKIDMLFLVIYFFSVYVIYIHTPSILNKISAEFLDSFSNEF